MEDFNIPLPLMLAEKVDFGLCLCGIARVFFSNQLLAESAWHLMLARICDQECSFDGPPVADNWNPGRSENDKLIFHDTGADTRSEDAHAVPKSVLDSEDD